MLKSDSTLQKASMSQFNDSIVKLDVNNPRKFGVSGLQSSFTLQRSVPIVSIPRSPRFRIRTKSCEFTELPQIESKSMTSIQSTALMKGTSLGYGSKSDFSKKLLNVPGPGSYSIDEKKKECSKGISILGRHEVS